MPRILNRYKSAIDSFLASYLRKQADELVHVNAWGKDSLDRISDFVTHGKSVRGSLVCFSAEAYGIRQNDDTVRIAAAVELSHAGLLIHDDVIDQDRTRRGQDALYVQYEKYGELHDVRSSDLFGAGMAICAGDLTFFLSMHLISQCAKTDVQSRVMAKFAREYASVCVAQMQDVSFGFSDDTPEESDVKSVYLYKTARYTCGMPLVLGSLVAHVFEKERTILEELGAAMGYIFQLRDDMINIYGNTQKSGKPVGSDIRERKKTMAYIYAVSKASSKERDALQHSPSGDEYAKLLYTLYNTYSVRAYIEQLIDTYVETAHHAVEQLSMTETHKDELRELIEYLAKRDK